MGYFANGWPKTYLLPQHHDASKTKSKLSDCHDNDKTSPPHPVHAIHLDPTSQYALTVSSRALHIWAAGQHRVLLANFIISSTIFKDEGPIIDAVWSPSSTSKPKPSSTIIAAFQSGLILFFSVTPNIDEGSVLHFNNNNLNIDDNPDINSTFKNTSSPSSPQFIIQPPNLYPLNFQRVTELRVAHADAVITCVTSCPAGALVATSSAALACIAWDGDILWRAHVPELLRHNDALSKMGVFTTISSPTDNQILSNIQNETRPDHAGGIIALTYNRDVAFCGIVLGDGPALLLAMHLAGHTRPSAIDGRWLRTTDSVSLALEPRRMLATVGLNNGDVEQYYIGVPAGDRCPLMRSISLSNWYFEPQDVGRPLVLQWTEDGAALVVGWERRGLAVWSVSGCRLMWTLPQVGGPLPTTPTAKKSDNADQADGFKTENDQQQQDDNNGGGQPQQPQQLRGGAMEQGVLAAAWGPKGYCLWACPRYIDGVSPRSVKYCHVMEFSFLKNGTSGSSSSICQSDTSRLAMLGSDRVLLLRHADAVHNNQHYNNHQHDQSMTMMLEQDYVGESSNELFSWQHLLIPHDYLWKNWPPTSLAVSADESHIAVAGEYGVAICHVRTQRWRVFGDLEHVRGHQRIRCSALAWVGRTIVIGNEVLSSNSSSSGNESKKHELLFYLRDQGESSTLQTRKQLPSKPVLTDVRADGYLLVMCEDARIFLFKMTDHYSRSRVDVREVYNLLLPTRESGLMYRQDTANVNSRNSNGVNGDGDIDDSKIIDEGPPPAPGGGITQAKIFPPLTHARPSSLTPETTTTKTLSRGGAAVSVVEEAPIPTHIMLLRSTGSLILLDTEQMVSTALLRYVERFWYTPVNCTPFDMMPHQPVWWAYGDDGLHVCFRDVNNGAKSDISEMATSIMSPRAMIASSRKKKVEVEQWFELDAEVYPLAIMSKYGMLLGVTQGLVVNSVVEVDGAPVPRHTMQVKRQPILHTLLRHILMKEAVGDERLALQVALKCVPQPQFVDSLEWLLYEAVLEHEDKSSFSVKDNEHNNGVEEVNDDSDDDLSLNGHDYNNEDESERSVRDACIGKGFPESPRRKKAGSGLFPRVIRLLKYFGEYEDIVVRCARKLDSKRWPLLFSLAGEPAALLEQCFVSGRLRTAACLLVILQEMWGFISSTPHSLRLVEASLGRGEVDLASDLANFLSKADRAGMLNSSQLRSIEDVSWIAEAVREPKGSALSKFVKHLPNNSRIPAVDLAVLNHARWLLNRMDLKGLVEISIKMEFPLDEWLKRELKGKNTSRPFVRDFGNTILSLHRQFQVAAPDLMDVRHAVQAFNIMESSSSSSSSNDNNVNGVNSRRMRSSDADVRYLMTVCRMARASDLTLCCATLLLDVGVLKMVLRGHEELFGPYVAALNELNVSGYDALMAVVNEVAIPK